MSVTPSPIRQTGRAARFADRNIGKQLARAAAISILFGALACAAQSGANPCKSTPVPALTASSDSSAKTETREQQQPPKQTHEISSNVERKKQISDESAKLLKLATELKADVDKTTKDTLSLDVIRKAGEIERLARSVKEKMKPEAGGS
jgi:hypothetical protein